MANSSQDKVSWWRIWKLVVLSSFPCLCDVMTMPRLCAQMRKQTCVSPRPSGFTRRRFGPAARSHGTAGSDRQPGPWSGRWPRSWSRWHPLVAACPLRVRCLCFLIFVSEQRHGPGHTTCQHLRGRKLRRMPGGNLSIRGGPRRGCGATGPAPDRGPRPPPETLAPNSRPRDPLLAKPARDPGLETLAPETPAPEPQALRPQSYEPGPRDPSPATPGADPGDMGTPTPASQRPSAFSLRAPGDPCPAEVPARPGRPRLASGTTVPGKREPPEARQDAGPEKGGSEGEGVRRPGRETY